MVGFEPTVHATKKRCLTTWLHPNCVRLITLDDAAVQDLIGQKIIHSHDEDRRDGICADCLGLAIADAAAASQFSRALQMLWS